MYFGSCTKCVAPVSLISYQFTISTNHNFTSLVSGIWISSAVISSPLLYGYGTYDLFEGWFTTNKKPQSLCSLTGWPRSARESWLIIQALVTYVFPFIVIVVAHFFIIRKLRKTRQNLYAPTVTSVSETITTTELTTATTTATSSAAIIASAGDTATAAASASTTLTTTSVYAQQLEAQNRIKDAKSANRDLRITKVLIGMTVWFVVCWTPWTVGRILSPFLYEGDYFFSYYPFYFF